MLLELAIQGLVQGVGFRPFVYLLAKETGIRGVIFNKNNGVVIHAHFSEQQKEVFIGRILKEHPQSAFIRRIDISDLSGNNVNYDDFRIISSHSESDEITQVAPDIAVCDNCLNDRKCQLHRIQYPFVNCTHCGPRFSIIRDLPYDREQTTMSKFNMCPACLQEYKNISDRRFHAQPVACNHCGPVYYTCYNETIFSDYQQILGLTRQLLRDGKIIAAKGIGGYHLICDATNETAVKRLRIIKARYTKPFAVMFRDITSMLPFVYLNKTEEESLTSWRRPIVLLEQKKSLASQINPGMHTLGCMLPYMPIHYDLFDDMDSPALVMTSGNLNDLPIIITPEEAERQLEGKVDLILHHDRPVYNRVDDSVLQVCGDHACMIRRSRGYVPEPFFMDVMVEGLLAFGAEKTNTFALGKKDTIIQSQYIGDMKNVETFLFYIESLERFQRLFRFIPEYLVCDLHPDYLSTQHAEKVASEKGLQLLRIQHHHAHAVACMLEYELNEPVLAVVWDGTGLGDDQAIWGGEFFLCDRRSYNRLSHLEYIPMPGGDTASLEPWRMAVASLYHYNLSFPDQFVKRIGKKKIEMVTTMMEKKINSPYTSSAGRLFDAFASLLGICDTSSRQAEAPVLLEQCAAKDCVLRYQIEVTDKSVSVYSIIKGLLDDLQIDVPVGIIAAKIHNSLADVIVQKVKQLQKQTGVNKVVVSGGCFQNKLLTEQLQKLLSAEEIIMYLPGRIPCNDSGIAAGQIAVAAARIRT